MAEPGSGNAALKEEESKLKEEVLKKGRGRPKKLTGTAAEVEGMKRFLRSNGDEESIFGRSSIVLHSPERKLAGE